jgi:hypothetical protein
MVTIEVLNILVSNNINPHAIASFGCIVGKLEFFLHKSLSPILQRLSIFW